MNERLYLAVLGFATWAYPAAATLSVAAAGSDGALGVVAASCIGDRLDLAEIARLDPTFGIAVAQASLSIHGRDALVAGLEAGLLAQQALDHVTDASFDPESEHSGASLRQYAVIDTEGRAATFTGQRALPWAEDRVGTHEGLTWTLAGNLLTGPEVLDALEAGLLKPASDLGERLVSALDEVRQRGGGDERCAPHPADAAYFELHEPGGAEPLALSVVAQAGQDATGELIERARRVLGERRSPSNPTEGDTEAEAAGCGIASGPPRPRSLAPWLGALCAPLLARRRRAPRSTALVLAHPARPLGTTAGQPRAAAPDQTLSHTELRATPKW